MLIEIVFFSCGNTVEHGVEKNVRSWFCSRSGSCSFFYFKCKYTLCIFFCDSFSMLHGHSLRLQDLRREATLSAFFSGIGFSCCMLTLWVSRICVQRLQLLWRGVSLQTEAHFWRLKEWDAGDWKSEERHFLSRLFRNVSRLSFSWKSSWATCRSKLHCKPAVKRASRNVALVRWFSYVFDARRLKARFVWNATKTQCSAACEPDSS